MSEKLIKPYEISVWEDKLTQIEGSDPAEYEFVENKIAVIGSNTMTGFNKVYDPVFHKKSNGEKTLTFSLKYKFFDPTVGRNDIVNPFVGLLVNERKVKLYYDNKWYEFIVKDHTESSDELTWTYTCTDAFVLELSKTGYNITFDSELGGNQGTAKQLGEKTLKDTDWQVGDGDKIKQLVSDPIYFGKTVQSFEVYDTDKKENITIESDVDVYVFYSYVKNKDGKFVQFIKQVHEPDTYVIDDNNVIIATNYRILEEVTITDTEIKSGDTTLITLEGLETKYQANRLVYKQKNVYDPITERTVDVFQVGDREIYKYTDYTYTTSNVITNFFTNGENFNVLEDGTLQGWNPYVDFTKQSEDDKIDKLELVTRPELSIGKKLADLSSLSQIEGFLKAQFKGALTPDYKNAIYNSGIENNASFIESISNGQEFIFRWRAGQGELDSLEPVQSLRLLVAKYTQDDPNPYSYYYKHIDPNNIIIDFNNNETPKELNNYIRSGALVDGQYMIDNTVQVPSTKYIYVDSTDDKEYVWNGLEGEFELKTSSNYLPYYYIKASAKKAIPNKDLADPTQKFGIFIYTLDGQSPIYIQDIQLTRYIPDVSSENGIEPITIGNVPTATSNSTDYYYLKPSSGATAEEVEKYTSIDSLAEFLEVQKSDIKPLYNEDSEKILTINESQSNCFNILQSIAETFECWVDLVVEHDRQGYITYTDNKPNKYVYFREYAGKDNWAGFKYGINLDSIERTINSDEIVTKLIVDLAQSEYSDDGFVTIANAPSNPSGEAYILNFDYYYKQGLLDESAETDRLTFIEEIAGINVKLREQEKLRNDLEAALVRLGSDRNTFTELVDAAQDNLTRGLADFENLTNRSYKEYQELQADAKEYQDKLYILTEDTIVVEKKKYFVYENEVFTEVLSPDPSSNPSAQTWYEILSDLTEEETIVDIIGELYINSAMINNYAGLATNIEQEYWEKRKELRGPENYDVNVWVDRDELNQRHLYVELSDYLVGFSFQIGGSIYTSTVSQKYFDLQTNNTEITFTAPEGYTIDPVQYTVDDSRLATFKINAVEVFDGVEDKIKAFQEQKDKITKAFNNKYRRFIQEGTWSSTDYIDSELYYLDALQTSITSAQPTVSYTINVVEVSELEGLECYLFDTGDKTYIEDTEFFGWTSKNNMLTPVREEVIVSEVEWHLDEPDKNVITVQNYKTRFEDLFQRISATVQTVQYNEATYAKTSSLMDANGNINQNVLLNSINRMQGAEYNLVSNGSIFIKDDSLIACNLNNPANYVIINNEGIKVSSDGNNTRTTVIDGQGINLGAVYTGTLNTNEVIIGNKEHPSFRWDKAGISAFKSNGDEAYDLQTYVRYDQYGLYGIKDVENFKAQNLQEVLDKAHFAVTWDGFFIKNSYEGGGQVEITTDNDFRVLKSGGIEKIKIGALEWDDANGNTTIDPTQGVGAPTLYGIRIKNDAGAEVMKTDDEGNITITGTINANAGNIGGLVVDDDKLTMDTIVLEPGAGIYSTEQINNQPAFIISDVNGAATFNNITARGHIDAQTGTLGLLTVQNVITVGDNTHSGTIQSNGYTTGLSGWIIKSNGTAEFQDAIIRGHIDAISGTLQNLDITGDITVDQNGYIQSNNYNPNNLTGWRITDTTATFNDVVARGTIYATAGELGDLDVTDTITVGSAGAIESANYSANDGWHIDNTGAVFNNARVRGEINATSGNFTGLVTVGKDNSDNTKPFISINGATSQISSSNYIDGAGSGWLIDSTGDAYFNNITARGAIKTAVFEYAEIQAVGGVFLFRPSSTIRSAVVNNNDLVLTVEKPMLFKDGQWCKISNYASGSETADGEAIDPDVSNILLTNGLTHVYQVSRTQGSNNITLLGAAAMVGSSAVVESASELVGGALVDMGNKAGTSNYGIGINSSDNTVNLPARAISLFETTIDETQEPKVTYNYRGILGTLPQMNTGVDTSIYQNMQGTQGIYTDNMYIGDEGQFIAFYEDEQGHKQLRIKANQVVYEVTDEHGQGTGVYHDVNQIEAEGVPGADGKDAIQVIIESSAGNMFFNKEINATLTCTVLKGGTEDITSQVTKFTWKKKDKDGNIDSSWSRLAAGRTITIGPADIASKAIFICEVEF